MLNFICVDPQCKQKGLICPVCQTTSHQGYQSLHLKVFLSEIHKTIYSKSEASELAGLADYLRSIDETKKKMVKALREMVEKLAGQVRGIEQKIESNYCELRKVILAQVGCVSDSQLSQCNCQNYTGY